MLKLGIKRARLWRPFIAVVVAYAVAAQTLLIALGALTIAARAEQALPTFTLCHHGRLAPGQPSGPVQPACNHCIFCFAASHHAVLGSQPSLFHRRQAALVGTPRPADKHCLLLISAHSIANPRGPPTGA